MNRYDKTNIFILANFFTFIIVIGRSDCKQMECGLTSFYYFFIPTLLLDKTSKNKIKFPKGASGETWHIKVPNPSLPQPVFNFHFVIFEGPGNPWIFPDRICWGLYRTVWLIWLIQSVTNIASSKCKFPIFWENPPLIHYHVYYPSYKPVCIYVSFKMVELPDITFLFFNTNC